MRYLFFASVWLHDYFILCQNRIFGINDPKTCPRLNTAEVTFVAYHCKDLKGVIWVGLLVVPKKISCLAPLFCIVIRNKEHTSKYFGMLTDFRTPTPQFLTSKYPPALLYHCSNTGFPPLPMWDKSLPSSWLTPEAGGGGGLGLPLAHFCFVHISRCPGSADFSSRAKIKLIHSFGQSVSIYAFMIIHSFIHSLLHSCIILSWIMKNAFFKFTSFFLAWVLSCFTRSSSSSS